MERYDRLSDEDLLKRLSETPPDTPDWIKSNAEMQRRVGQRRAQTSIDASSASHPKASELTDPLREVARKERRLILTVSMATLAIVLGNLVPTEVESLGIRLSAHERNGLLVLLALANAYLLVAFAIYGAVDVAAWKADFRVFIREKAKAVRKEIDASTELDTAEALLLHEWPYTRPYELRAWFEYWPPILVSGGTLLLVVLRILGVM